ncbi:MAG: hypothetical protein M1835_006697 [Candelina submexicana]|nr:MAG: hypothetical protein M1835_006697 [Candelina submexicana]
MATELQIHLGGALKDASKEISPDFKVMDRSLRYRGFLLGAYTACHLECLQDRTYAFQYRLPMPFVVCIFGRSFFVQNSALPWEVEASPKTETVWIRRADWEPEDASLEPLESQPTQSKLQEEDEYEDDEDTPKASTFTLVPELSGDWSSELARTYGLQRSPEQQATEEGIRNFPFTLERAELRDESKKRCRLASSIFAPETLAAVALIDLDPTDNDLIQLNNLRALRVLEAGAENLNDFAGRNGPDRSAYIWEWEWNLAQQLYLPASEQLPLDRTVSLSSSQLSFLACLAGGDRSVLITSQGRSAYEVPESTSSTAEEVNGSPQAGGQIASPCSHNNGCLPEQRQRYNVRGHPVNPESRTLARMSVRAHNDVLATVGACVDIGSDVKSIEDGSGTLAALSKVDREKIKTVMTENELGLIISTFDTSLVFLAQWALVGVKFKLQTFRVYSAMSFRHMLYFQPSRFGFVGMLYANVPALLTHTALNFGGEVLLGLFEDLLESCLATKNQTRKRTKYIKQVVSVTTSLAGFALFLLLAPLKIHSTLQLLSLAPARPAFPPLFSLIPFSPSSYVQCAAFPTHVTIESVSAWASSVVTSPVAVLWVSQLTRTFIGSRMFHQLIRYIPKPDNPDAYSSKAAIEDSLDASILPGLHRPNTARCAQPSHWDNIVKEIRDVRNWFLGLVGMAPKRKLSTLERVRREIEERITQARQRLQQERRATPLSHSSEAQTSALSHDNNDQLPNDLSDHVSAIDSSLRTNEAENTVATDNNATPPSPSASSSSPGDPLLSRANSVRVSSRRGDTDLVTMEVEINGSPPTTAAIASPRALAGTLRRQSLSDETPKGQLHHVSCLSNYPAEMLANRLSTLSTELLLLPLQGVLVRTIAWSFLKRQGGRTEGLWGIRSGYTETGIGGYMKNMAACFALEVVVGMGLWEVGLLGVRALGKSVFGWGKL